ncbi:nuclear receptor subfamily 0 group B member 2a [Conger conger]|uniref:nuclear receptor subfamily 0 group B member 2a n=1 Tax=Conger conger TaxID=82655 RepID=UPI002A5AB84F|nr:nuclear receptor subfamily 0 group B member 2a [Conger conger]
MSHTERTTGCRCSDYKTQQPNAILFNILSQSQCHSLSCSPAPPRGCHCERSVSLATPSETAHLATGVLLKTLRFMRSLPSFQNLPLGDQLSLLRLGWGPAFILGLAQEGVDFQVTDRPAGRMLKQILLEGQGGRGLGDGRDTPTLAAVHKLKACLHRLWGLDLTPKEYAYLKGAVLFNPDVPQLESGQFVAGLQQEAQLALREVVTPLHPHDTGRFARILLATSALRSINQNFLIELFFRPLIGPADLFELLVEMLFSP